MATSESEVLKNDALSQLRRMNERFIHNFVTNDAASHNQITHPDFVCITEEGEREPKHKYISRWSHGFDPEVIVYWDYRDEDIKVFGDVALVRSTNKHVIVKDGRETTGMTAYTDTYLKESGRWKCVQAQLTPVSPEHYPPDDTIVKRYLKGKLQS